METSLLRNSLTEQSAAFPLAGTVFPLIQPKMILVPQPHVGRQPSCPQCLPCLVLWFSCLCSFCGSVITRPHASLLHGLDPHSYPFQVHTCYLYFPLTSHHLFSSHFHFLTPSWSTRRVSRQLASFLSSSRHVPTHH